jgi:hypothetical protein
LLKVTSEIREAARRLLTRHNAAREHPADKKRLEAIADGKRKLIDADWWRKVHGNIDRAKLDKIAALADPARNANEHERRVAATKLASAKARRRPGMGSEPPPLPTNLSEWVRVRRPRKTKTAPSPQPQPDPKVTSVILELSDSATPVQASDSVARLKALNERRAAKRASLKCQSCGEPLAARRVTARYCNATCRSQAWRAT